MTFWVVRAGKHGENEDYVVDNNIVALGWASVGDLSKISDRDALKKRVQEKYPFESVGTQRNWTGELWAFKERIQKGDWVAVPLKTRAAIAVGRITGPYKFDSDAPAQHQRSVQWVRTDIPRSKVDQDLLYTLGSTLTVFRASRNDAEARLVALAQGEKTKAKPISPAAEADVVEPEVNGPVDIEQIVADQITNHIGQKFTGHEFARLVAEVLKAEGYQVQVAKPGADGGVDIIAGTGPMGFASPRIAVQVKSGDTPVDVKIVRELQGVMPQFGADHGLVVSWAGFKDSVLKESRQLFFKIRLWDSSDLVAAVQKNYERLPEDIQAELPLKRIWLLVTEAD